MNLSIHGFFFFLLCSILSCCAGLKADEIPDRSKVEALVRQLGDEEFSTRQQAQEKLQEMGEPVEKLLKPFRNDPDPEIRKRVEDTVHYLASLRRELKWIDPKFEGNRKYISETSGRGVKLTFRNHLKKPVRIFWINTSGERQSWRGMLKPGAAEVCDRSYMGHIWLITDADEKPLGLYKIDLEDAVIAVRPSVKAGR